MIRRTSERESTGSSSYALPHTRTHPHIGQHTHTHAQRGKFALPRSLPPPVLSTSQMIFTAPRAGIGRWAENECVGQFDI